MRAYPKKNMLAYLNERAQQRAVTKNEASVLTAFHTIFHIASTECPLSHYADEVRFLAFKGDPGAEELVRKEDGAHGSESAGESRVKYSHHESCKNILGSIATVMEEDIFKQMRRGPYAIIIDESTDISTHKTLAICGRYFNEENAAVTKFLINLRIEHGDAKSIAKSIITFLTTKDLDPVKNVGLASDGASVMMGHRNGVGKRLRDGNAEAGDEAAAAPGPCPFMIHVHCVAHRLNLCSAQAAKDVFNDVQEVISMVYRFFKNSAERTKKLHEIESLLDNTPTLKLKEPIEVRWLSLDAAVETMYRVWHAVALALEAEATNLPKAKGILQRVIQFRFLAALALFRDVLPVIAELSRRFQSDAMTFHKADGYMRIAKGRITDLQNEKGVTEAQMFDELVEAEGDDGKVAIKYRNVLLANVTQQQRNKFLSDRAQFLQNLLNNFDRRFPEESHPVLQAFELFASRTRHDLKTKSSSFQKLVEFYGDDHEGSAVPLIDSESASSEWKDAVHILPKYEDDKMDNFTQSSLEAHEEDFPNIAVLLKLCQVVPMSSVSCERAFSTQEQDKEQVQKSAVSCFPASPHDGGNI